MVEWKPAMWGRLQESHRDSRGQSRVLTVAGAGTAGRRGQKYDDRFMNATRRIGVPQRAHGSPSRP